MKSSNVSVFSNFFWRFFERLGAQGVKLLVELVLARLLLPEDYGLIAIVTVIINILNVFVDSGLGNALIQKKNADDLDFSSVFWFNIVWCILLYCILFFLTPAIASFYNNIELINVIRVLGLQIVVSGIKNIQQAFVSRTLQFKKFFFATLGGTLGAAILGILLAYFGFGVWALVAQQLFNATVDTIILWITVKWKPKFQFSFSRLKSLFGYGWKILVSALIDTFYNNSWQLIIGKAYSSSDLAFYNKGNTFPNTIVTNINISINSVLFPTMSSEQDNVDKVKSMTRRAIKTSIYIFAPLMIGLAFVSEPFIRLLLTDKWLPAVPYMRIMCITYLLYPIHTANLNAIKAMGRSDLFLKLEIIKKIVGIIALVATMNISVMAMAYSLLAVGIISQIINAWPNRKLLNYPYMEQVKDILPSVCLAIVMGAVISLFGFLRLSDIITLLLQISVGTLIYFAGSIILKLDSYIYLKTIILKLVYKRKGKS